MMVLNVSASHYYETTAAVRYLTARLKINAIAAFYQCDAYGF